MKTKFRKAALAAAVAGVFAGASGGVQAAAFALIEQNASGMGNAYAGAAAVAEDASTIFFNPAGLARLTAPQVVVAGHVVAVSTEFSNSGASTAPTLIGTLGGNGGDAGDTVFIPNAYFSMPIDERLSIGVGLNAPFGLATEYDADWVGRFQGIKSELMTINVNPTVAYRVNDMVSVGAGISYQTLDAELTNKVNGAAFGDFGAEYNAVLEADDAAWGWNIGALFDVSPTTTIGVSYRSTMDYTLEGSVTVTSPGGAVVGPASGAAEADVTLPDMFSVSLVQAINDRLDLLADVTYTRWSEIKDIRIIDPATGATRDTLVLNFDDSYRYSIGVNYKYTDRLMLKAGVAFDESPVSDADRTVRLPDDDRTWVALGGSYRLNDRSKLDFGYAHLFVSDVPIDQDRGNAAAFGRVVGSYDASIDILSVQYTHNF
ncbi:MAG: outer membrane protein transport protein [Burkholderiales bacterium]